MLTLTMWTRTDIKITLLHDACLFFAVIRMSLFLLFYHLLIVFLYACGCCTYVVCFCFSALVYCMYLSLFCRFYYKDFLIVISLKKLFKVFIWVFLNSDVIKKNCTQAIILYNLFYAKVGIEIKLVYDNSLA